MKRILILGLIGMLIQCGPAKKSDEHENESFDFYYPEMYDDWWRFNEPKLVGARGYIGGEWCLDSTRINLEIEVLSMDLVSKGWGEYRGNLLVKELGKEKVDTISYNCFLPNYEQGIWLNKLKRDEE